METREIEVIGFVSGIDIGPSKARVVIPFKIVNADTLATYELICLPLCF